MEDLFSDLTEEEIQQLIELGIIPEQQEMFGNQLASAQALRNKPGPEGREAGGMYIAASPLEHLARVMEARDATKQIKDITEKQNSLLEKQVEGRKAYLNKFRPKPSEPTYNPYPDLL